MAKARNIWQTYFPLLSRELIYLIFNHLNVIDRLNFVLNFTNFDAKSILHSAPQNYNCEYVDPKTAKFLKESKLIITPLYATLILQGDVDIAIEYIRDEPEARSINVHDIVARMTEKGMDIFAIHPEFAEKYRTLIPRPIAWTAARIGDMEAFKRVFSMIKLTDVLPEIIRCNRMEMLSMFDLSEDDRIEAIQCAAKYDNLEYLQGINYQKWCQTILKIAIENKSDKVADFLFGHMEDEWAKRLLKTAIKFNNIKYTKILLDRVIMPYPKLFNRTRDPEIKRLILVKCDPIFAECENRFAFCENRFAEYYNELLEVAIRLNDEPRFDYYLALADGFKSTIMDIAIQYASIEIIKKLFPHINIRLKDRKYFLAHAVKREYNDELAELVICDDYLHAIMKCTDSRWLNRITKIPGFDYLKALREYNTFDGKFIHRVEWYLRHIPRVNYWDVAMIAIERKFYTLFEIALESQQIKKQDLMKVIEEEQNETLNRMVERLLD